MVSHNTPRESHTFKSRLTATPHDNVKLPEKSEKPESKWMKNVVWRLEVIADCQFWGTMWSSQCNVWWPTKPRGSTESLQRNHHHNTNTPSGSGAPFSDAQWNKAMNQAMHQAVSPVSQSLSPWFCFLATKQKMDHLHHPELNWRLWLRLWLRIADLFAAFLHRAWLRRKDLTLTSQWSLGAPVGYAMLQCFPCCEFIHPFSREKPINSKSTWWFPADLKLSSRPTLRCGVSVSFPLKELTFCAGCPSGTLLR